ncbi:hypothetical protein CDAR_282921 [Caerostris darwini]|uniref:Uncharacterized protein n=1 Tax=Caerostris darwini TaxID=1538125 RepID=A0AAV4W5U5_9ARAC|nr:hypothetical protein CDAR_282921 [Caerostris darwini]
MNRKPRRRHYPLRSHFPRDQSTCDFFEQRESNAGRASRKQGWHEFLWREGRWNVGEPPGERMSRRLAKPGPHSLLTATEQCAPLLSLVCAPRVPRMRYFPFSRLFFREGG